MTLRHLVCTGFIILLTCLITPAQGAEPRLVKVGAFNYYPAIFKDTDGQIKGFYVDALADLAERENLRIEYVYGSWNEGLERIRTGEVDLLTSVAHTPERASYMDYTTTPLLTVWGELYVHHDTSLDTILEVKDKKIAIMRGDYNGQYFVDLTKKFEITCTFVELPDFEAIFTALAERKVDAGVVNNIYGVPKQKDFGLRSTGVVFNPFNIYFTVAKGKNRDLLLLLDYYLKDWRDDPDSVFASARQRWSHATYTQTTPIPQWFINGMAVLGLVVAWSIFFIILLKKQVARKTRQLTKHQSAEQENLAMVRLLLDSTAEGIYALDRNGSCTLCNASCLAMLGYEDEQQLLGSCIHELIHHTHPDGSRYDITECPIVGSFRSVDKIHCDRDLFWRRDGSGFPVEYWSYPIVKDGTVLGAVVTFIDITERRRAEQCLRESEERYRSIFENSRSVMMIIAPENGAIVDANPAAAAYYGWTREQLQQMLISDINILSPDQIAEQITLATQTQQHYFHFKHRLASGEIRDVEVFSGPVNSEGQELLFSIIHDITERKITEQTLLFLLKCGASPAGEDFFQGLARYLAETLQMDFVCIDRLVGDGLEAQTVAVYHDGQFEDNVRYALAETPCGEVVGTTICRFNSGVCRQFPNDAFLHRLKAESYIGTTLWGFDGKPIGLIALISRRLMPANSPAEPLLLLVAVRAASELERRRAEQQHHELEEQLRHAQRMEAIGTLAGGIAHDFNNILTAIIGYAHISQIGLPAEAPQRAHIQQITEAANRATHLTRDLLLFSRKQSSNKRLLDLNELVNNTHSFLQRIIGEKIRLVTRLPEQAVMLDADPQQLDQVLMNLATNARDAMPDGGTITISISCEQYDDTIATQHNLPRGAEYAVIQFCDDGRGIPAELLDKIFDPFFTTKDIGKGTGLGLPIVYGIITNHHGALKVTSSPGNGSCFTIHLPCSHQQGPIAVTPQVDEQLPRGNGETILLAEDNERVRSMASQVLTEFGYQVLTAVDGDDAVRLFRQHADQVRLLMFDMVMPNLGCYEAYQQIQQLNPAIRIIFTTGYAPQVADNKLNQQQLDRLLHKPFAVVQLLKTVRSVLDAEENQA